LLAKGVFHLLKAQREVSKSGEKGEGEEGKRQRDRLSRQWENVLALVD